MRERLWTLALGCGLLLLCSQVTFSQEWTRFRGPNGSGQSEAATIPATWTEDEVLWKTALPGQGNASPVVWGDRVFLISANPDDGTRYVLCLSATDGELLWKRDYPSHKHHIHQLNTLASSTPTVDAQRVYCAWSTPEEFTLLALTHDGEPVWKANLGAFASQHGFGTSPILYEDTLIIANDQDADSFVIAVEAASGKTRWKVPRRHLPEQNTCYATPCVYRPEGRPEELILCSRAHGVTSIDPHNGETNWEAAVLERRAVSSPIVVDGLVLATCGAGGGQNTLVALRPTPTGTNRPSRIKWIAAVPPTFPRPWPRGTWCFCGATGASSLALRAAPEKSTGASAWGAIITVHRCASPIASTACRMMAKPWPSPPATRSNCWAAAPWAKSAGPRPRWPAAACCSGPSRT